MLRNYIKIALRNLIREKGYSFINIFGLALGISCCLLIMLWVSDELSYDRFHENSDRIYRIDWMSSNPQTRTPHPMTTAMVRDLPEVENAVSISPVWGPGLTRPIFSVRYGDNRYDETGVYAADTTFFQLFSFELIKGNPRTALKELNSVIITEEIALKYFGKEDPMGKILVINDEMNLKVSGIMEDIPPQSHFHFDFLLSYNLLRATETGEWLEWGDFGHFNYLLLAKNADSQILEERMIEWSGQYIDWSDNALERLRTGVIRFGLTPITDIHLHSNIKWELEQNGSIHYVYIFIAAALFILIIACINFMNLSTARSLKRAKEVAMRKTIGATKKQLVRQFLGESLFYSFISIAVAVVFCFILLPEFNFLTGKELSVNSVNILYLLYSLVGISLVVGIVSGSYPAFFLASFNPIAVFKNDVQSRSNSSNVRKFLVLFQFSMAVILIIGTLVIIGQVNFLKSMDLGFDKDQIVIVPLKNELMREGYESIKNELITNPSVINASAVSNIPGKQFNQNSIRWIDGSNDISVSEMRVDYDFFETLDIGFVEGRGFSQEFPSDAVSAFILNMAASNQIEWPSALNENIIWDDDEVERHGKVIGVARNFHFKSLHQQITPMIFQILPEALNYFLIKVNADRIPAALSHIETVLESFNPEYAFEYTFLDEEFNKNYQGEEKMAAIFEIFSFLAIFVGCIGLFGLASFMAERRKKEIGIRKVLGASIIGIVLQLSRDFTKWVLAANIIAWPVAYFLMKSWLNNFPYRTELSWLIFITAGLISLSVAVISVGLQAFKAARSNPAEILMYE